MSGETGLTRINHIIKSTLAVIEESRGAILDIADNSRKEVVLLKDEIKALQAEVQSVIRTCERLERMTLKSRIKLATISEDYDNYSEEEMRAAYEEADKLRVDLAVWRERERQTILRRNELERRLKNAEATLVKAEKLVAQVSTVLDYLAGDLSRLDEHIESTENKRVLALRIIKTQEEERRRIAREMHDGPAQSMTNVVLKAELCERLSEVDMDMAKKELSALKDMVRDCLKEIRRIIYDLRPMSIDDLGLKPTLQKYIENFTSETDIRVELMFIGSDDNIKDSNIALTVFRLVQECLNNVKKHADATEVIIQLECTTKSLIVRVKDDGKGFDTSILKMGHIDSDSGYGVIGMQERVELLEGSFSIDSKTGRGTTVRAVLPFDLQGVC